MEAITKWKSFDGEEHITAALCRAHEKKHAHKRLVGLTEAEIERALDLDNPDLADAIEVVGSRLARARVAAGNLKRATNSGETRQITHQPPGADEAGDNGRAGDGRGEDEDGDDNAFTAADVEGVL